LRGLLVDDSQASASADRAVAFYSTVQVDVIDLVLDSPTQAVTVDSVSFARWLWRLEGRHGKWWKLSEGCVEL